MSERLSEADVRKVAALAKLAPTDEEVHAYRGQLSAILGYVQRLQELNLDGVEPMTTPLAMAGPTASDEVSGVLPSASLHAMAPATDGPFIRVPKVLGEGGGA